MKDISVLVLAAATALALVAVVVFGADDATTRVSPPEQVAEGFVRKVAAGRYELASNHMDHAGEESLTDLRSLGRVMHSAGAIERVEGIPGTIAGDRATASALVKTSQTEMRFDFELVRRQGVWKIAAVRR